MLFAVQWIVMAVEIAVISMEIRDVSVRPRFSASGARWNVPMGAKLPSVAPRRIHVGAAQNVTAEKRVRLSVQAMVYVTMALAHVMVVGGERPAPSRAVSASMSPVLDTVSAVMILPVTVSTYGPV